MARQPSLRSQLNQIRAWVRQGRTDAWVAHQLDISIDELARFKREHDLEVGEQVLGKPADPLSVPPPEPSAADESEDQAEVVEIVERSEVEVGALGGSPRPRGRSRRGRRGGRGRSRRATGEKLVEELEDRGAAGTADEDRAGTGESLGAAAKEEARPQRSRRRGRRGGRRRRRIPTYEATFDHGEVEGYGLWLDPSVADNPVYAEHWAGHRAVVVRLDPDVITIRRA